MPLPFEPPRMTAMPDIVRWLTHMTAFTMVFSLTVVVSFGWNIFRPLTTNSIVPPWKMQVTKMTNIVPLQDE